MKRIEQVKNHFEQEAKEFDEIIQKLIPYYNEMVESLINAIPFSPNKEISVFDLGCGTGTIAKAIKEKFVNSRITCLDLAENMIKIAKTKLSNIKDVEYVVGDFYTFEFPRKYDVVVSSLALHHLETDADKKKFYQKVYNALNRNGIFYNADNVIGSNAYNTAMNIEKWIQYMRRKVSAKEIESKWLVKYKQEDRPAPLVSQLKWLEKIGFKDVDVIWKYYNFAVYGGKK